MPSISINEIANGPAIVILFEGYRTIVREGHIFISIPSKRNPNIVYRVHHTREATTCTCPGFSHSDHCWHAKLAREKFSFPEKN